MKCLIDGDDMLTQELAEEIVKEFSPTTKVTVQNEEGKQGIYLQNDNEIIITSDWSIAGLLHEITHAVICLRNAENKIDEPPTYHDGIFADKFTQIVNEYMNKHIKDKIEDIYSSLKDIESKLEHELENPAIIKFAIHKSAEEKTQIEIKNLIYDIEDLLNDLG